MLGLAFFRRRKALTLLVTLIVLYTVIRLFSLYDPAKVDLSVGSKNFTESLILGEMYAQALERVGFKIQRKFNLGGTLIAHEALKRGEIDLYPEYTGTGLIDVLKVSPPREPDQALALLSTEYRKRWGLCWLNPAVANNSQGLVMTEKLAAQHGIANLSELAKQSHRLRLGAIPEFEDREDGLKGLRKFYGGFQFKKIALYDNGLKYQVLKGGDVDVTVAFTTDGALMDSTLRLLRDDQDFWPAYRITPVVRCGKRERDPLLEKTLNRVSASLDTKTLQALNYQVDQRQKNYRVVVRDFLAEKRVNP